MSKVTHPTGSRSSTVTEQYAQCRESLHVDHHLIIYSGQRQGYGEEKE